MAEALTEDLRRKIIDAQRDELTEHIVYDKLAKSTKDENNGRTLRQLSEDELGHYNIWKGLTKLDVKQKSFKVWRYLLISRLFGLTFGLKLMERREEGAQEFCNGISEHVPEAVEVCKNENRHERQLLELINEERLKYVSSMVLGLNDALVEMTGALAGFTFALQNTQLIGMTGLITGIAASLSMGASEYLSTKSEGGNKSPREASMYTTLAYFLTVAALVAPFVVLESFILALVVSLFSAVLILFVFTFYIAVAKDLSFRKRFLETASVSLGVAGVTFVIGLLVRVLFGVGL